jgi:hypothetical protein
LYEKKRRAVGPDQLVFVGMHNVAQTTWCPMQAVLTSRREEALFFRVYLTDRIRRAERAGLIRSVPRTRREWLAVGDELTWRDVEAMRARAHEERAREKERWDRLGVTVTRVVEPPSRAQDVKGMGAHLESVLAEKYPSTRWHFAWEQYVIVGRPDGLTPGFVYEFKTTKKRYASSNESKSSAFAQADLYGVFFERPNKRVQIHVRDDGVTDTWQEPVDRGNAIDLLRRFRSVDEGESPALPPAWKCRVCEFRTRCPLLANPG